MQLVANNTENAGHSATASYKPESRQERIAHPVSTEFMRMVVLCETLVPDTHTCRSIYRRRRKWGKGDIGTLLAAIPLKRPE